MIEKELVEGEGGVESGGRSRWVVGVKEKQSEAKIHVYCNGFPPPDTSSHPIPSEGTAAPLTPLSTPPAQRMQG